MVRTRSDNGIERNHSVEDVLDTIGDPYARDVLATLGNESRSVKEIADSLEHSINTVYRRVNLLSEHGLVESSMEIADDGNHRQRFETTFDSVVVSVGDDEYDVEIYRRDQVPDRFTRLWDELSSH